MATVIIFIDFLRITVCFFLTEINKCKIFHKAFIEKYSSLNLMYIKVHRIC